MAAVNVIPESRLSSNRLNLSCFKCSLCNLCSSYTLNTKEEGDCFHEFIKRGDTINRGEYLFKEHRTFESLFSVRSGAFKTYLEAENGEVQITGFYLPGDIIGLDSTNTNTYNCSAKALELSSFCEIPFPQLEKFASENSQVQHHFFSVMSAEIQTSRQLTWLLSKKSAEERIVFFLLNLSARFKQRNLSATHFRLPMARIDIGNYLGLAVETVSRVLTRFHKTGLISAQGREVVLSDVSALVEITKHD